MTKLEQEHAVRTALDAAWHQAHQLERASRMARRHPEAEAQIAAAREPPTDMEIAMQEVDRQIEQGAAELRKCAHAIFVKGCASCEREQQFALRDGVGWAQAVAAQDARRKVLTTNHPEVTDPAERDRLELGPLEVRGCSTPGCGFQAGHLDKHPCGQPVDVGPHQRYFDSILNEGRPEPSPQTSPALTDEESAAYDAFCSAAAALEEHHERAQALQGAYLGAQATLARVAAKRVRGR